MPNKTFRFWKELSTEKKLSLGFFGVVGIVMLLMGFIQLRRNIIFPFTAPVDRLVEVKKLFGPTDDEKAVQAQKTDTDGDGLSDWDEENVFLTSMYLADTDSDGMNDDVEIANGSDPQCPSGENCGYVYKAPDLSGTSIVSYQATSSSQAYGSALPLVPNRDATSIRAYLKAQGMTDAQLNEYTDAELLDAYDESVTDFNSSSGVATTTVSNDQQSETPSGSDVTTEDLLELFESQ